MSPTRHDGQRISPTQRATIHAAICGDLTEDTRFEQRIPNARKVQFICGVCRYPEKIFDVEVAFPLDDWYQSGDMGLLHAGLYLADLRMQFYGRQVQIDKSLKDALFTELAEAEHYRFAFQQLLTRKVDGMHVIDGRVLN